MNPTVVPLMVFAAATFAVVGIGSVICDLFLTGRLKVNARLDEEFGGGSQDQSKKSPLFKDLKLLASEAARSESSLLTRFQNLVDQSGLVVTTERILSITLITGLSAGVIGFIAAGPLVGIALLLAGIAAPISFVNFKRKARIRKIRLQLPDAFGLMSRAIRAGQTVTGAFQVVANDCEAPLSEEFEYCHEQQALGLSQEVSLRDLARRTGVMELQMFVVAMLVQRQSGGNPVEVLNNLSDVIRKRVKLLGKVQVLTGEGRMQALVLLVMPPLLLVVMYFLNRSYTQMLLDEPTLLTGMFASECVGALWIRKIVNFDF